MKLMNMTSAMTMTSLEVVDVINDYRDEDAVLVRHDDLLKKVRKLLNSTGFVATESTYKNSRNQTQPCYVMDAANAKILLNTYSTLRYSKSAREKDCLAAIEQVLGITLERQFSVGKYRIDGYDIANKVAYEIDEALHRSVKHQQADREREAYIYSILGCTFKRITI